MTGGQPIELLRLNTRAYNSLKRTNINTVKQLEMHVICELRDIRNMGKGTIQNVLDALKEFNGHEMTCDHYDQACITWLKGETHKWRH